MKHRGIIFLLVVFTLHSSKSIAYYCYELESDLKKIVAHTCGMLNEGKLYPQTTTCFQNGDAWVKNKYEACMKKY